VYAFKEKKRPKTNSGQKKFDAVSKKKSFGNEPTFQVPLSVLLALLLFLYSKAKGKKGKMLLKPFFKHKPFLDGKRSKTPRIPSGKCRSLKRPKKKERKKEKKKMCSTENKDTKLYKKTK
jgi:hypothetical protein